MNTPMLFVAFAFAALGLAMGFTTGIHHAEAQIAADLTDFQRARVDGSIYHCEVELHPLQADNIEEAREILK